jgi:hypothetical protein
MMLQIGEDFHRIANRWREEAAAGTPVPAGPIN